MKKYFRNFLIFLTICLFHPLLPAQPCREVIGYYPNWQWYDRNKLVSPATIDFSQYSIINYCFFSPEANGTITNTDNWADENLLQGETDWSTTPPGYIPNTSLIDLAHNAGVKVLVSIGGWTLSNNFPVIAADPALRATFASECNRLLSFYNFDGIDIDWEYPGYPPHGGTPQDKGNFTLLMQQVRDSIDALGQITGKSYLLTACFGASPAHASNIEWSNLLGLIDMFNIMSYDYFGAWDCVANHNAPLGAPAIGNPDFNFLATYSMLKNLYQVPAHKINMGVAFYGRSQTGATGLYSATSCNTDNHTFPDDLGSPLYYNILQKKHLFNKHWDAIASVPYLLGKPGTTAAGTFVSYDDLQSLAMKTMHVINENIRGVIIWEITGDYIETAPGSGIIAGTPLADTINKIFCNALHAPNLSNGPTPTKLYVSVQPVPANTVTEIVIHTSDSDIAQVVISSMCGKIILQKMVSVTNGTVTVPVSLAGIPKGVYLITALANGKKAHSRLIVGG